jgi:hypothetical protein
MFLLAEQKYIWYNNVYERLFDHILETEWFYSYKTILAYGFDIYKRNYYYKYGVHSHNIHTVDGLQEALYLHYQLEFINIHLNPNYLYSVNRVPKSTLLFSPGYPIGLQRKGMPCIEVLDGVCVCP